MCAHGLVYCRLQKKTFRQSISRLRHYKNSSCVAVCLENYSSKNTPLSSHDGTRDGGSFWRFLEVLSFCRKNGSWVYTQALWLCNHFLTTAPTKQYIVAKGGQFGTVHGKKNCGCLYKHPPVECTVVTAATVVMATSYPTCVIAAFSTTSPMHANAWVDISSHGSPKLKRCVL